MTTPNLPARLPDVDPNVERLLGFFSPVSVAAAYESNNFDVQELSKILIEIARDVGMSGRERLAALKLLKDQARESLETSSIMQKLVATAQRQLPDGSTQTVSAEVSRIRRSAEETQRLLQTGLIQAQLKESKEEPKNELSREHGRSVPEGDVVGTGVPSTQRPDGTQPHAGTAGGTGTGTSARSEANDQIIDVEFAVSGGPVGTEAADGHVDRDAGIPELPNFDTEFLKLSGARSPTNQSRVNVNTGDAFERVRGDGTL